VKTTDARSYERHSENIPAICPVKHHGCKRARFSHSLLESHNNEINFREAGVNA